MYSFNVGHVHGKTHPSETEFADETERVIAWLGLLFVKDHLRIGIGGLRKRAGPVIWESGGNLRAFITLFAAIKFMEVNKFAFVLFGVLMGNAFIFHSVFQSVLIETIRFKTGSNQSYILQKTCLKNPLIL